MGCGCVAQSQKSPLPGCSCWCPCRQSVLKGPALSWPYHLLHSASVAWMNPEAFTAHLRATLGLAFMKREPLTMFHVLLALAGGPSLSLWKIA